MPATLEARHVSAEELVGILAHNTTLRRDLVVPASKLRGQQGGVTITEIEMDETGVGETHTNYRLTRSAEEQLARDLGIPPKYARLMRDNGHLRLWDDNFTTWIGDAADAGKSWMLRTFKPEGLEESGIVRAVLSDRYRIIDHYDVLGAAIEGIGDAGVEYEVDGCDLTDRTMRIRFHVPSIAVEATELLKGYRTPFEGPDGNGHGQGGLRDRDGNLPIVTAGFELRNSETGHGGATLTPRLVVKICNNGMVIGERAIREVHVGARHDEGEIEWSEETLRAMLKVITQKARDAAATFCTREFVAEQVDRITQKATTDLPAAKSVEVVTNVSQALLLTENERNTVLDMFIRSGQTTVGGVMQAITAAAQTVTDPDRAAHMEHNGLRALDLAHAAATAV